ncbi:MAG: tetratricopeptide repeat protein [Pseudomonadota bacterium]
MPQRHYMVAKIWAGTAGVLVLTMLLSESVAQPRNWTLTPDFNFAEYLDTSIPIPGDIDVRLNSADLTSNLARYAQWITSQGPKMPRLRTHMTNLAVMLVEADRYDESIAQLEIMVRLPGRFDPVLQSRRFLFLGDLRFRAGEYDTAVDAYRTAQQLTHVHAGVLDDDQIVAVDRVIRAKLQIMNGDPLKQQFDTLESIDTNQEFTLYVNAREHGLGSDLYTERLLTVADYLQESALALRLPSVRQSTSAARTTDEDSIMRTVYSENRTLVDRVLQTRQNRFRQATQYYKTAIEALEDRLGSDHPSLITPLTRLAEAQSRRDQHRQSRILRQRIVDIAVQSPLDVADQVGIVIGAADALHRRGDDTAMKYYEMAWDMLSDQDNALLREQVLGEPQLISRPLEEIRLRTLPKQPPVLIVSFNIPPTGQPTGIMIVESTVNVVRQRSWVSKVERLVYRPRWGEDGPLTHTGIEQQATFILPSKR